MKRIQLLLIIFLGLFLSSSQLLAAEQINNVLVKGNKKIERAAILAKISSKSGQSLSRKQIRQDILKLHNMGFFDSVNVFFDSGTLSFVVKERKTISKIIFYGNSELDADDLKEVLQVKPYGFMDENKVRESVRALQKHYEDKGFYLAKVDFDTRPAREKGVLKEDSVELLFNIREYDKVRVKSITFLGNKVFTDDQLKRILRNTKEKGFFSWLSDSGNFKELDFKTDMQILQYWYLNEGHIRFSHNPPIVNVSEDKKWVYITIRVNEGEKYSVSDIDFSGDILFTKEELYEKLKLKKQDTFAILKRNQDVLALTERNQDLGYANVNVIPQMQINDEELTVDINYEIEKGSLVRFGKITVKGNTKTRDKVVRRELRIREGELYSGTGMRVSKENVARLGFFAPDKLEFVTSSPPGRTDIMDVEIVVEEKPTGQFQLGAGYGTASKFFFTMSIAETNFLGRGQDLRFSAEASANTSQRNFTLSFTDPYAFDTKWSVGASIAKTRTNAFVYTKKSERFVLNVGYPLMDYTKLFMTYYLEKIKLLDIRDPLVLDNEARENGTKSSIAAAIVRDKRNNRRDPTGGYYASLKEEVAGLGGNRNFLQTVFDLRYFYRPVGKLTWRTKLELANIASHDGLPVQSDERYKLGGANQMRGFRHVSIGPRKALVKGGEKFNEGGTYKAYYVSELVYPLLEEVGINFVTFYEIGTAFNEFSEIDLKQDWGFGLRWFSPLGPLRFEWAYPINRKIELGERKREFTFMIGTPF